MLERVDSSPFSEEGAGMVRPLGSQMSRLELLYVDCGRSFGSLLNFEANTITFP